VVTHKERIRIWVQGQGRQVSQLSFSQLSYLERERVLQVRQARHDALTATVTARRKSFYDETKKFMGKASILTELEGGLGGWNRPSMPNVSVSASNWTMQGFGLYASVSASPFGPRADASSHVHTLLSITPGAVYGHQSKRRAAQSPLEWHVSRPPSRSPRPLFLGGFCEGCACRDPGVFSVTRQRVVRGVCSPAQWHML